MAEEEGAFGSEMGNDAVDINLDSDDDLFPGASSASAPPAASVVSPHQL